MIKNDSTVGDVAKAPYRPVRFFSSEVELVRLDANTQLMRSGESLEAYDSRVGEWLDRWADKAPERNFLVEQTPNGERKITFGETREQILVLAEGLLRFPLNIERPLIIIAPASIDYGLLMIAAYYVGIPFAPVAPAYAAYGGDFSKLRGVFELLTPGLVVVADGVACQNALQVTLTPDVPVFAFAKPVKERQRPFAELGGDGSGRTRVTKAAARVLPTTIAKFLFTSGSTGVPKAVINTHRMLCASAQQQRQVTAFLADEPPVMVDWLPWNHTAGGNAIFNIALFNGGTLYIDPGKPTREHIGATVELLKRVSPTLYFNVPLGFEVLLPHLEQDAELRRMFFKRLQFIWYAAATMQLPTWNTLERLAMESLNARLLILTGLGMTETSPATLFGNLRANGPGVVGVPIPGVELKLISRDKQFEALFRGPNVTPGYWRDPEATQAAFDPDGFLLSGDLVSLVDPQCPEAGLRFEGRAGNDFKLSSGTRVSAEPLRLMALEVLAPLISDLVVVGAGREDVRILMFPDWERCAREFQLDSSLSLAELAKNAKLIDALQRRMNHLARTGTGISSRIVAGILVTVPPSPEAGECTEKGTINGRLLQRNRPQLLNLLFGSSDSDLIIRGR